MTALPAIFSPEPGDDEDVVSALETADIFWNKGDADEALRWLKRAAETASDAGNDMRALAIARSVADLKAVATPAAPLVEAASKMSRPPPPSSMARQAVPSAPAGPSGDGASRSHAAGVPHKTPPPLPPSKTRESTAPPPPSAVRTPTSPPPAPSATMPLAPSRRGSTDRMAAVTADTRAAATPPTRSATPSPAAVAEVPARRPATVPSLPKEPERAVTLGTAYRALTVFVKPQGRNGDKLEVFLAKPGQAVPAGAEPALLVPTRRGGRLLG
jgi:hypothetical protein